MKEHKRIQPGATYRWTVDGASFTGKANTPTLLNGVWHVTLENASINVSVTVPVSEVRP